MAKQGQTTDQGLEGLTAAASEAANVSAAGKVRESDSRGRLLRFRTNVDDWVPCDSSHRLRFEAAADGGLTPYLHVRSDLWAKVTRALYYDLVDMGEERVVDAQPMFGVASGGEFFPMAGAEQVRGAL